MGKLSVLAVFVHCGERSVYRVELARADQSVADGRVYDQYHCALVRFRQETSFARIAVANALVDLFHCRFLASVDALQRLLDHFLALGNDAGAICTQGAVIKHHLYNILPIAAGA